MLANVNHGLILPRGYRKPTRFTFDPAHALNRGLTSYWPLGNKTSSGEIGPICGRHLKSFDDQLLTASHHGGLTLNFNGTTNYMQVGTHDNYSQVPGSWCIWIKTSSLNSGWPSIMSRANTTSLNGISIFIDNGTSKVRCQIKNSFNTSLDITGGPVITDGEWHLVVLTFTSTSICTLYVDGVNVARGTPSPSWSFGSYGLNIGKTDDTFFTYFLGALEGVRVYRRLLGPQEVMLLYREPYAGVCDFPAGHLTVSGVVTAGAPPPIPGAATVRAVPVSDRFFPSTVGRAVPVS